ncbi:MAG TPA: AI-2E family transporter [Nocardioidaceae bacterium]|nr:AI-2E family transporter [Nocardioidaceae bacterium]
MARSTAPFRGATAPVVSRPVLLLVGAGGAVLLIAGLHSMAGLVGPVFLALVLVVAAHPIRPMLTRRGVPPWLATGVVLLVIYATIAALVAAIAVSIVRFALLVPSYDAEWHALTGRISTTLSNAGIQASAVQEAGTVPLGQLLGHLADLLGGLLGAVSVLALVVTVAFFVAIDAAWLPDRVQQLPLRRRDLGQALATFASGTRRYLVVSTVFGLVVALLDTAALFWLGVPGTVLWGLLAFVTNYVPNIGFFIGLVPPTILALLEGGPGLALAVVAVYIIINFIMQSLIQPRIVGGAVGLSPTLTMLSLVFWAFTLGALGALMAVPLTLLVKALLVDADPQAGWVRPLLAQQQPKFAGKTVPRMNGTSLTLRERIRLAPRR